MIKNCISVTSHAPYPLPLSQTVTPRTPSPLERDVLYGRPLKRFTCEIFKLRIKIPKRALNNADRTDKNSCQHQRRHELSIPSMSRICNDFFYVFKVRKSTLNIADSA